MGIEVVALASNVSDIKIMGRPRKKTKSKSQINQEKSENQEEVVETEKIQLIFQKDEEEANQEEDLNNQQTLTRPMKPNVQ